VKSRSGYTIIELLVVVAIMAITAGTLVSFNRLGQDQVTMYVEASKIVDVILRAKSLAISAYREPGRATCAHGIFIDTATNPGTFSLNRYLKKEATGGSSPVPCASIGSSTSKISYYDPRVVESSSSTLSRGIVFDAVETNISNIIFRPPDPEIFFFNPNGDISLGRTGTIVIKNSNSGDKIRIVVGQGGQITYNFID